MMRGIRRLAFFLACAAGIVAAGKARSHDVYRDFYDSGEIGVGRWCCSGNLEGTAGDCSPAQYTMNRDGSAFFTPKQHPGQHILVPRHRILWMQIPNRDPRLQQEAAKFEAHWCGRKRYATEAVTDDDPDPGLTTIGAARAAGGAATRHGQANPYSHGTASDGWLIRQGYRCRVR